MFEEHQASALMPPPASASDGQQEDETNIYYIPPMPRTVALKNKRQAVLATIGSNDRHALKVFRDQKSVFCTCDGNPEDAARKHPQYRKSKICPQCGRILPGGILLGRDKELNLASDRLR